jgi:hypothetical protein
MGGQKPRFLPIKRVTARKNNQKAGYEGSNR